MKLTPIQKTVVIWLLPCVVIAVAASLYAVSHALYMQTLINDIRATGEVSEVQLSQHQYDAWVLLYLAPPFAALALFLFPFACIRLWYGRKKGPGAGYFDATLVHAKNDLLKSIRGNKSQKEAEKEAIQLSKSTSKASQKDTPRPRL